MESIHILVQMFSEIINLSIGSEFLNIDYDLSDIIIFSATISFFLLFFSVLKIVFGLSKEKIIKFFINFSRENNIPLILITIGIISLGYGYIQLFISFKPYLILTLFLFSSSACILMKIISSQLLLLELFKHRILSIILFPTTCILIPLFVVLHPFLSTVMATSFKVSAIILGAYFSTKSLQYIQEKTNKSFNKYRFNDFLGFLLYYLLWELLLVPILVGFTTIPSIFDFLNSFPYIIMLIIKWVIIIVQLSIPVAFFAAFLRNSIFHYTIKK